MVVQLGEQSGITLPYWKETVEAFMDVIKNRYSSGLTHLKSVLDAMKDQQVHKLKLNFGKNST